MICIKCGNQVSEDSVFCAVCGAKVADNIADNQTQEQPEYDYDIHTDSDVQTNSYDVDEILAESHEYELTQPNSQQEQNFQAEYTEPQPQSYMRSHTKGSNATRINSLLHPVWKPIAACIAAAFITVGCLWAFTDILPWDRNDNVPDNDGDDVLTNEVEAPDPNTIILTRVTGGTMVDDEEIYADAFEEVRNNFGEVLVTSTEKMYTFYDIDGNGVKELIIRFYTFGTSGEKVIIYTLSDGIYRKIYDFWDEGGAGRDSFSGINEKGYIVSVASGFNDGDGFGYYDRTFFHEIATGGTSTIWTAMDVENSEENGLKYYTSTTLDDNARELTEADYNSLLESLTAPFVGLNWKTLTETTGLPTENTETLINYEEAYAEAFADFRSRFAEEYGNLLDLSGNVITDIHYSFYDIDKNGIDELIISNLGHPHGNWGVLIYTLSNDAVVQLYHYKAYRGGFQGINESGYICSGYSMMSNHGDTYDFDKIADDGISLQNFSAITERNPDDFSEKFFINAPDGRREVTEDEFYEYVDTIRAVPKVELNWKPLTETTGASAPTPSGTRHPFAIALQEYFADAEGRTFACLVEMDGGGLVMLADKYENGEDGPGGLSIYHRFYYFNNNQLEFYDVWGGTHEDNNHLLITSKNYLITSSLGNVFVHLFIDGKFTPNALYVEYGSADWSEQAQKYGFDTYDTWTNRPDQTAEILAMTISEQILTYETSFSPVPINGEQVYFESINIDNGAFYNIRDLAMALNGSEFQFSISESENAIIITINQPYSPIGGELTERGDWRTAEQAEWQTVISGVEMIFKGYIINGNYYFTLADLTKLPGIAAALSHDSSISQETVSLEIVQIDSSEFPTVKLYVNILDDNNNTVTALTKDMFELYELDLSGRFNPADIEEFRQLLETENLSVNLVIDKSGSMTDYNRMEQARNAASFFLNYLEGVGSNLVEMTYFDSAVIVPKPFTDDFRALENDLYNISPNGQTALYDALYYALLSTNEQRGAKCVIAFTDGEENSSRCTFDDVVSLAQATGIPLYLVGVGYDINEAILIELANLTGGAYFSAQNDDLEQTLKDIYTNVYNKQRERYIVQYRSNLSDALEMPHQVVFRARENMRFIGEAVRDYTPVPATLLPPQSLSDAVFNTNDWVRITLHWPDWSGTTPTVFERDKNSPVWTQASRDGYTRIVDAEFTQSGSTIYIGIPTTDSSFILEEDGTGSLFSERLTWTYETDAGFPLGSSYGIDLSHDLRETLSRDALIVIRAYWNNGDFAYFYRNNQGGWQMRGRQGGIITINPNFDFSQNSVDMSFSVSSSNQVYVFSDGGSGFADNENITWTYSYIVN